MCFWSLSSYSQLFYIVIFGVSNNRELNIRFETVG